MVSYDNGLPEKKNHISSIAHFQYPARYNYY